MEIDLDEQLSDRYNKSKTRKINHKSKKNRSSKEKRSEDRE